MKLVRNTRTPEGQELGKHHARFFERAMSDRPCELDDRCSTCACRLGTVANGSPQTQMDFLKCCAEGVNFMCHEKGREGILCHGFRLLRHKNPNGTMPWPFSDEVPATQAEESAEKDRSIAHESQWMAVSREGHNWIHQHPREARAKGFLK